MSNSFDLFQNPMPMVQASNEDEVFSTSSDEALTADPISAFYSAVSASTKQILKSWLPL